MSILSKLKDFIKEYNQNHNIEFGIDSIRIEFSKQHKKEKLQQLGRWKKINKKDQRIMTKLKKRLDEEEITSAYQLENYNIYYYNSNKDKPHYRKAMMIIFGLKQYHKKPPPSELISNIISILKNVSNIDVSYDFKYKPNIQELYKHFQVKQFVTKDGLYTDTYYINTPNILMIDKITIYDKQKKNNLDFICWRVEALITIPNIKYLALPLQEFKQVIELMSEDIPSRRKSQK